MKARRNSREMFPLIAEWERSGQTQQNFCDEHGLNLGLFSYWRKKYLEHHVGDLVGSEPSFLPIELASAEVSGPVLEMSVGRAHLSFHQFPEVSYLKKLLGK